MRKVISTITLPCSVFIVAAFKSGGNIKRAVYLRLFEERPAALEVRLCARQGAMRYLSATAMCLLALLISSFALSGCTNTGTPVRPKILTFNYKIATVRGEPGSPRDASTLISEVQSGQRTVSDLLRGACNFTADFSSRTPPQIFTNGTPGQTGFSVRIVSTVPVNTVTTNPSPCNGPNEIELDPNDIAIDIGAASEAVNLGVQTSRGNGKVFAGGLSFATSEFFQAQINGFDPATGRSNGEFRFINRREPGSNTVVIVEGSYAMP